MLLHKVDIIAKVIGGGCKVFWCQDRHPFVRVHVDKRVADVREIIDR